MSRVNKLTINIPEDIHVLISENELKVKGFKGELSKIIPTCINIEVCENIVQVFSKSYVKDALDLCGTYRGLINNMFIGVSSGFKKKLELQGVGYKAHLSDNTLVLNVGYSHPVNLKLPLGIQVFIDNNTNITVVGIDKELVGHTAASIRLVKPPEPYKGKGIRYQGEHVRKKIGKAGKK